MLVSPSHNLITSKSDSSMILMHPENRCFFMMEAKLKQGIFSNIFLHLSLLQQKNKPRCYPQQRMGNNASKENRPRMSFSNLPIICHYQYHLNLGTLPGTWSGTCLKPCPEPTPEPFRNPLPTPRNLPGTLSRNLPRNLPGTRGSEAAPAPPRKLYWQRPHS